MDEKVAAMVAAVKAYALAHYESNGWDYVIECWEDSDIAEKVAKCRSDAGAIAKMKKEVAPLDERRREVRAEIW